MRRRRRRVRGAAMPPNQTLPGRTNPYLLANPGRHPPKLLPAAFQRDRRRAGQKQQETRFTRMFVGNDVTATRAARSDRAITTGRFICSRTALAPCAAHCARASSTSRTNESTAGSHKISALSITTSTWIRICDALTRHTDLPFGTNRTRACILAVTGRIAIFADIA